MTVRYRNAVEADLASIDRVFRESFCDTFAHLYGSEDLDLFLAQFTPEAWLEEFSDGRFAFRIAKSGSRTIGFIKLGPLTIPVEANPHRLELRQFYLLKPWHGAGVAEQLMEWALAEARSRGVHELYLTVFTENHRARRFYRRYGFVDVGPCAFMVGNHADEDIIMKLAL